MSETPGFIVQQELFDEIAHALYELLSEGDEYVYFTMNWVGPYGEAAYWAVRQDGKSTMSRGRANALSGPGNNFVLAVRRLRKACYVEGKGTWFSVVVTVTPDGAATAEYNYDTDPKWEGPIEPTIYVQQQEKFPRDLEHQPEWYRQRLAEGQAALEEYRRDPQGYYDRKQ